MMDRWYFRLLHEEFGPVPQSEIGEMLAAGRLAPDDEVRREGNQTWVPVRSLGFDERRPDEPEELHDLTELDFQFVSSSAAAEVPKAAEPAELHDLSELDFRFAESDRPAHPPRPASRVEESTSAETVMPRDELDVLPSDEDIPLLDDGDDLRPLPPSPPRPRAGAMTPRRPPSAPTDEVVDQPEPRREEPPPNGRRGESLLAACLSETPATSPRPKRRARRGLLSSLAQVNPLLLAVLALGVLIQGWRFLAADGRDAAADYRTLSAHYQELLQLREQNAPSAKWDEFAQRARADLEPMAEELESMTTAKRPAQQQVLFAVRDGLLRMLAESPQAPSMAEARDFIPAMREAHALLGLPDLPSPPQEITSMAPRGPVPQRPDIPVTESAAL